MISDSVWFNIFCIITKVRALRFKLKNHVENKNSWLQKARRN